MHLFKLIKFLLKLILLLS